MNGKKALVVGGSNGIGLSIALELSQIADVVTVVDKSAPTYALHDNMSFQQFNLLNTDYSIFNQYIDYDILVITAGFGRIAPFESFELKEVDNCYAVNATSVTKVLSIFFPRINSSKPFYCAVMGSIAGLISSPMLALYGATKAAVCKLVESVNAELCGNRVGNRILNVAPGSIKGTRFYGAPSTDLSLVHALATEIIDRMFRSEELYIPDYDDIYKGVLERYRTNPHQFGLDSYRYKLDSGRMNLSPQLKIGYLSGTFDLFHIGHLNMLKRAKDYCDYLVVGVHKDASHKGKNAFIPYEERLEIVKSVKYVDKVIQSEPEDDDVYIKGIVKYDMLFVGSDYKGTERFNRYERFFADKNVKIIYFPYTQGTSSTQLRESLDALKRL